MTRFPDGSDILHDVNAGLRRTRGNSLTPDEIAAEGGYIVEAKVASAKLDDDQILTREQVREAGRRLGREDIWFDAHMPTHDLGIRDHIRAVRGKAQDYGFTDEQIELLVKEVRDIFPRTWPKAVMIAATELILLSLYLDEGSEVEAEQVPPVAGPPDPASNAPFNATP